MSELHTLLREMRASSILATAFERAPNAPTDLLMKLQNPRRASLSRDELLEITLVKLKGVAGSKLTRDRILTNSEEVVKDATKAALSASDAAQAIEALTALHGVGVAVASSLLSWCRPERWPVIDRRACATLSQFRLLTVRRPLAPADYVRYDAIVSRLAIALAWSPQRVDRWLYAFDKCHLRPGDSIPK